VAVRIGLSGWSYPHWRDTFYLKDLPQVEWLRYVAERFPTVEVNRTFYSLLRPDVYRHWVSQVPDHFTFSIKGSRFITHLKSLRDVEIPLANFFASGVLELQGHLDTVLWQLPARTRVSSQNVIGFLSLLPATLEEAARLAAKHDERAPEVAIPATDAVPIRHALEIRNPDILDADLLEAARSRNVALARSHSSRWPLVDVDTADFAYFRLHGPGRLYASRYGPEHLDEWEDRIIRIADERDVLVYFDNDENGHAPRDALDLMERLMNRPKKAASSE
jgi:uncharacterized protein YecE (DUF72 family)